MAGAQRLCALALIEQLMLRLNRQLSGVQLTLGDKRRISAGDPKRTETAEQGRQKSDARVIKNHYSGTMEYSDAARVFGALAQESRLGVLRLLLAQGPNGLSAGELAERLGTPASTTSFHLSALERAGLISATRQGRQIIYAVRIIALRELLAFLTETCCGGRPELCGDIAAPACRPFPKKARR